MFCNEVEEAEEDEEDEVQARDGGVFDLLTGDDCTGSLKVSRTWSLCCLEGSLS